MRDRIPAARTAHTGPPAGLFGLGTTPRQEGTARPARRLPLRRAAVLPMLAAVALLGGCGDSGDQTAAVSAKGAPPSVEKLAGAVKCKAKVTKKVEDYRLGSCKKGKTLYTFVTFKDNEAKRGWLDYSKSYGGTYLVGSRWIALADADTKLAPVQAEFGGTIEEGASHGHGRT